MERCSYSYYDRVAYCQICDITGEACEGFVEDCEHKLPVYGRELED